MRRAFTVAVLAASLLAIAVPTASAKGLFGVIPQALPLGEDIPLLRKANPATMRFVLEWTAIQGTKGPCKPTGDFNPGTGPGANNCNWAYGDQVIGITSQAGVTTMPFISGSPKWLDSAKHHSRRSISAPPLSSKADKQAWKTYVSAAVDRYGPGGAFWDEYQYETTPKPVKFWQIWNEPSSPVYFAPRPAPKKYAQLLKISNQAVAKADPKAKIVAAGVFGSPRRRGGGIPVDKWFEELYKVKGVEKHFDVAAMHPYAPNVKGVEQQIEIVRDKMKDGGDGKTKLWISELGWGSDGPKGHTLTSTPKGQAKLLTKAFKRIKQKRAAWKIIGVNWFSWRDVPKNLSSCAACPYTGLLKKDLDEKPAFRAFQKFT
jgi:hypothetical protein